MPSGLRLGGAYFTIEGSAAPLIQALNQAEQASKKSVAAISAATGIAEKDVQRLAQTYLTQEKRRADASAAATLRIIKSYNDASEATSTASAKATVGIGELVKGFGAFAAAATGVRLGAESVRAALEGVAEATGRASQAQFALNKLYGASAPLVKQQADALALLSGRSKTEASEAAASVATLGRNYALTSDQIQKVLKISADLAAVRGISLAAAAERTQSALRGEAEAIEYLGQALGSNALKAFGDMTDAQRKQFETLNDVTKAQIVLNTLTKSTADLQGAAAERTKTAAGSLDNLRARIEDLEAAIGEKMAPSAEKGTSALAGLVEVTERWIRSIDQRKVDAFVLSMTKAGIVATLGPVGIPIAAALGATAPSKPASEAGPTFGPSPQEVADAQARTKQEQAAEKDRQKAIADVRKRARELEAQAGIEAAEAEHDRAVKDVERRRILAETEKENRLRAIDAAHTAAMRALEDEQRAAEQANKDAIAGAERQRDAEIKAAEDTRDGVVKEIEARREELKRAREQEDRDRSDARASEDRAIADSRDTEDRDREASHTEVLRQIEDEHKAAVDAIDDEAKAARAETDEILRDIEKRAQREDDRHRKALQRIDDERDRELAKLDVQLKALDAQERAENSARRVADLQKKVADAQTASTRARGTGTPEQIAQARGDLTRALRVGDEVSIANARERLVQLAGQGNEAIREADEKLAAAQQDLQEQVADSARDAEREKLKAAEDAIKQQADDEKRAEDDRNRRRKRDLDDQKQTEQDKLKATLARLDKQKDAEGKAHDQRVKADKDEFERASQLIRDRRRDEDRALEDRRKAEDRDRQDRREAEDAELEQRRKAADDALEKDRQALRDHYDGPDGVITFLKKKSDDIRLEYQQRSRDLQDAYNVDKRTVEDFYRNSAKTGVLDKLDDEKTYLDTTLNDEKARWEQHKKDLVGPEGEITQTFDEARRQFDRLLKHFKDEGGIPVKPGEVGTSDSPGSTGGGNDGGGPGPGATVPSPFRTTFGFDEPYNGPYGGAAWPGGPTRHRGIDLALPGPDNGRGSPYGAFQPGTVVSVIPESQDTAGGNGIIIQTDDGLFNYYGHNDRILVDVGQHVARGEQIGILGRSGLEAGIQTHLHYEVRRNPGGDPVGSTIDPVPFMNGFGNTAAGQPRRGDQGEYVEFEVFGHKFRIRIPGNNPDYWLRAAMRQAGVDKDWLEGLQTLLELENPRHDPKAVNPKDVYGVLGGDGPHAKGLLQMIDETFERNRDQKLPDDIFNPIANATSAINYIHGRYGSVYDIPDLRDPSSYQGYRYGGWVNEPVIGMGLHTMSPYAFAETGPELVLSPETAGAIARNGGGSGAGSYVEGDINLYGAGTEEVMAKMRREQRRRSLLHGPLKLR